jgi:hypothetical protein
MGGCKDGMAVVWRQWESVLMEWRSFGDKGWLQGWTEDHSAERKASGIELRSLDSNRGCRDGMAIAWRQGNAAGMEDGHHLEAG